MRTTQLAIELTAGEVGRLHLRRRVQASTSGVLIAYSAYSVSTDFWYRYCWLKWPSLQVAARRAGNPVQTKAKGRVGFKAAETNYTLYRKSVFPRKNLNLRIMHMYAIYKVLWGFLAELSTGSKLMIISFLSGTSVLVPKWSDMIQTEWVIDIVPVMCFHTYMHMFICVCDCVCPFVQSRLLSVIGSMLHLWKQ